jgi:uncharacterized membrane protein
MKKVRNTTKIHESVYIDRAPDEVFAFVVDVTNEPKWQSSVVESTWLDDGPIRPGRQARTVSSFLGMKTELVGEITRYEPSEAIAWKIIDGPFEMEAVWRFQPEGRGTLVVMDAEKVMASLFANLADPLVTKMFSRQLHSDMENLKEIMESSAEMSL